MKEKIKLTAPVVFTLCLVTIFYFKRYILIKYYPPVMNGFIFSVFFISLFCKGTVIQKIARIMEGGLNEKISEYTRNLTYVWCVFLFINFLISILTIFLSDRIWIIYNGFVSYFLVGLMFVIEYPIRLAFKRRHFL